MQQPEDKPFAIPKPMVWEAWRRVRANKGAPGVDGQAIEEFEADLAGNLYKIWNRMSSGSYLPPPVRAVEIPKPHGGGVRMLGVPTIADRVAQTVVAMHLEERADHRFHPDSYGYRPGKSAHQALAACRQRCWKYDWLIDLDVQKFFDEVPRDLVVKAVKAVKAVTDARWVLLYVERWLAAPLELGADAVVHSATKYLGGHSDVVGGAVIVADEELHERVRFVQNAIGAVPGPFDCFLVHRGLRTLHLRVAAHTENGRAVSEFLLTAPGVEEVRWPGFGGMVSFRHPEATRIAAATEIFTLAESLGSVESLIEVPQAMTHQSVEDSEPRYRPTSSGCHAASKRRRTWWRTSGARCLESPERAALARGRPVTQSDPSRLARDAAPDGDLDEAIEELGPDPVVIAFRGERDGAPESPVEPLADVEAVITAGAELGTTLAGNGQDALRERDVDVLRPQPRDLDPDHEVAVPHEDVSGRDPGVRACTVPILVGGLVTVRADLPHAFQLAEEVRDPLERISFAFGHSRLLPSRRRNRGPSAAGPRRAESAGPPHRRPGPGSRRRSSLRSHLWSGGC
jgi:Cys/Met metabolism PLP-dependent enzyme/Reverse transcriptase (RNA-dependent DNA polymerase)